MSGREQALAEEVARQQALRWVEAQLVASAEEMLSLAVEHIERLVDALEHGDVAERADALAGARAFLAEMNDEDDVEPDDPPTCPCGEPATVELLGDSGWLCSECAA